LIQEKIYNIDFEKVPPILGYCTGFCEAFWEWVLEVQLNQPSCCSYGAIEQYGIAYKNPPIGCFLFFSIPCTLNPCQRHDCNEGHTVIYLKDTIVSLDGIRSGDWHGISYWQTKDFKDFIKQNNWTYLGWGWPYTPYKDSR